MLAHTYTHPPPSTRTIPIINITAQQEKSIRALFCRNVSLARSLSPPLFFGRVGTVVIVVDIVGAVISIVCITMCAHVIVCVLSLTYTSWFLIWKWIRYVGTRVHKHTSCFVRRRSRWAFAIKKRYKKWNRIVRIQFLWKFVWLFAAQAHELRTPYGLDICFVARSNVHAVLNCLPILCFLRFLFRFFGLFLHLRVFASDKYLFLGEFRHFAEAAYRTDTWIIDRCMKYRAFTKTTKYT